MTNDLMIIFQSRIERDPYHSLSKRPNVRRMAERGSKNRGEEIPVIMLNRGNYARNMKAKSWQ